MERAQSVTLGYAEPACRSSRALLAAHTPAERTSDALLKAGGGYGTAAGLSNTACGLGPPASNVGGAPISDGSSRTPANKVRVPMCKPLICQRKTAGKVRANAL